jgi:hypothetical protein
MRFRSETVSRFWLLVSPFARGKIIDELDSKSYERETKNEKRETFI